MRPSQLHRAICSLKGHQFKCESHPKTPSKLAQTMMLLIGASLGGSGPGLVVYLQSAGRGWDGSSLLHVSSISQRLAPASSLVGCAGSTGSEWISKSSRGPGSEQVCHHLSSTLLATVGQEASQDAKAGEIIVSGCAELQRHMTKTMYSGKGKVLPLLQTV